MRSTKPAVITITRYKDGVRSYPAFIEMAHRHCQKEVPVGTKIGGEKVFIVPIDLLRVVNIPEYLLNDIEEVQIAYRE